MDDDPFCTCGHFKSNHSTLIQNCEDSPGCQAPDCWCAEFDPEEVTDPDQPV